MFARAFMIAAALAASAVPVPALAAGSGHTAPRCFFTQNFQGWKAPDARTIYIRVSVNQYYRLDLSTSCPALMSASPHLITTWRGSNSVCSAIDWDLKVSRGFPDSATGCIVKTMTPLTAEEAAAIPRKYKP